MTDLVNKKATQIIGLDPGSLHFGYSVITEKNKQFILDDCGVLSPKAKLDLPRRLHHIYEKLDQVFSKYPCSYVSIEETFYHKNAKSSAILNSARAVGLLLSAKYKASLLEFSPRKIKLAVTGSGSSSKEKVQILVEKILKIKLNNISLDESDAIAIGLCGLYSLKTGFSNHKARGSKWSAQDVKNLSLKKTTLSN